MEQLLTILNGLGPWGVLAGAVLVLVVQYLRPKLTPTNPAPVAPATPAPASDTPILDAVLNLLRLRLLAQNQPMQVQTIPPPSRDIDPAAINQLLGVPVDVGKVK